MLETDLKYKPYIDGLRAIAVILVILFHLQPSLFPAGYLGVDIFFVISGFVISQSLYHDYLKTGKINIGQFYKKRFKRLYPALLAMVSITTICYVFVGFLWDTNFFIKSSISSIFAVSNLYFLYHGDDYFAQDLINPLLHTWSLGVEEQFYFVYPILLAFGLWYINKRKLTLRTLFWVISGLSLMLYVTFAAQIHATFSNFYFPTARFWELGIGCALFFLTQSRLLSLRTSALAGTSLLALFFVLILQPHINNIYIETLGITLGTAGIIFAGINRVNGVIVWLESKVLVFVGKISYSLYLWHMPVIYFSNLYLTDAAFYIASVAATAVLATLSYYVVEKPLRYSDFLDKKLKYFAVLGVLVLLVSSVGVGIYGFSNSKKVVNASLNSLDDTLGEFNYIEKNFSLGDRIKPNFEINGVKVETACVAMGSSDPLLKEECFRQSDSNDVFFLTGDSHAMHFVPMFNHSDVVGNFYFKTLPREMITDESGLIDNTAILSERTAELNLLLDSYDEVYYINSLFLDQDQYELGVIESNLDSYIKQIDHNIRIIFIAPTPIFRSGPESCVILGKYCTVYKSQDLKRSEDVRNLLKKFDQKYESVHFYDPYDAICPNEECINYIKDKELLLYRDDDHLSVEGSEYISSDFDKWFQEKFEYLTTSPDKVTD